MKISDLQLALQNLKNMFGDIEIELLDQVTMMEKGDVKSGPLAFMLDKEPGTNKILICDNAVAKAYEG